MAFWIEDAEPQKMLFCGVRWWLPKAVFQLCGVNRYQGTMNFVSRRDLFGCKTISQTLASKISGL